MVGLDSPRAASVLTWAPGIAALVGDRPIRVVGMGLVAGLLCGARLGGLGPFGLAFFFSTLPMGATSAVTALATVLVTAVMEPDKGPAVLGAVALGWALAGPAGGARMRRRADLLAAASVMAARLVASGLGLGRPPLWWVETLAEALLAWSLVRLWGPLVARLDGADSGGAARDHAQSDEGASPQPDRATAVQRGAGLVLGAALVIAGLERLGLGPMQPAAVAMAYLTLAVGTTLGPTPAVAVSVTSGLMLGLADPRWGPYGLLQAAAALACAAVAGSWRVWPSLCLVGVTAAGGLLAPTEGWGLAALAHAGTAALLFLLTPARTLARLERLAGHMVGLSWGPPAPTPPEGRLAVAWLGRRLSQGVARSERVVEALRAAYETAAADSSSLGPDPAGYVGMVQERACAGCPSFAHCWEDAAQASMLDVLAYLERAEARGRAEQEMMPPGLARRCIRPVKLAEAVEGAARAMAAMQAARHQSERQARRLLAQVDAARGILQTVARIATTQASALDLEGAQRLARYLAREGWPCREVVLSGSGARREALVALMGPCRGQHRCARSLERLLGEYEGVPWMAASVQCRHGADLSGGGGCEVHLVRRPLWDVEIAFATRTRDGEVCSGDSFARLQVGPALVALVLSDGMGSGPEAARESETAVRLAEAALAAGAGAAEAIQVANAVLLARAPDERFATLDVALVDLATGELELGKAGAYPTLVAYASGVERIEGRALPAGIVAALDVEPIRRPLEDGTVVVMVTDGAGELGEAAEGCLAGALEALRTKEAEGLAAEAMLERVMDRLDRMATGRWPDDVTVALMTARQLDLAGVPAYTGIGAKRSARAAASARR